MYLIIGYFLYFRKLNNYLVIILRRTACLSDAVLLLPENMIEFEKGIANDIPILDMSGENFNPSWCSYLNPLSWFSTS